MADDAEDAAANGDIFALGQGIYVHDGKLLAGYGSGEPAVMNSTLVSRWSKAGADVRHAVEHMRSCCDRPEVRRVRSRASKVIADVVVSKNMW